MEINVENQDSVRKKLFKLMEFLHLIGWSKKDIELVIEYFELPKWFHSSIIKSLGGLK